MQYIQMLNFNLENNLPFNQEQLMDNEDNNINTKFQEVINFIDIQQHLEYQKDLEQKEQLKINKNEKQKQLQENLKKQVTEQSQQKQNLLVGKGKTPEKFKQTIRKNYINQQIHKEKNILKPLCTKNDQEKVSNDSLNSTFSILKQAFSHLYTQKNKNSQYIQQKKLQSLNQAKQNYKKFLKHVKEDQNKQQELDIQQIQGGKESVQKQKNNLEIQEIYRDNYFADIQEIKLNGQNQNKKINKNNEFGKQTNSFENIHNQSRSKSYLDPYQEQRQKYLGQYQQNFKYYQLQNIIQQKNKLNSNVNI
ncbi:hypothetical protein PPERSA_11493 [Pseudocohnilembus persalinus]|uniref:Uncharacterized protein n=1 Tax=Pseudocohnilembus persalinus TaxID=266149 RepID=A0A0V0QXT1_PSEPJ|nr:hypothetical protein PPERSA_11493 [Pseudocohnilembus persalinus]|eukprot:KRX06848.1 hypothetical protein PPERSA_11493 [Pseudocohnilembus persalinus]